MPQPDGFLVPEVTLGASRLLGLTVKRGCDVASAAILLALGSPVLLLAGLAIALEDGFPVLFFQERIGRGGRPFQLAKLRTMKVNSEDVDALGQIRSGHHLVLKTGKLLRRAKIDELVQLWNVLRGDMSLVGPRPTIASQVKGYDAWQRRRLEMRPGLSGWAQVNGNVELTWDERILLDIWYLDHWSLWLDARILLATVRVVLLGEARNDEVLERAIRYARSFGWSR